MKEYLDYLDHTVAQLQQEAQALQSSDRADEANFVKIRINVCGICKTVFEALQRVTPPSNSSRRIWPSCGSLKPHGRRRMTRPRRTMTRKSC